MTDRYQVLHRQFCQRFALNPETACITRHQLLVEAAFRSLELEGAFQPDRFDFVLSAIAWMVELIMTRLGFQFDELDSKLLDHGLKFRKRPEKTQEQIISEKNEQTSRFFFALKTIMDNLKND